MLCSFDARQRRDQIRARAGGGRPLILDRDETSENAQSLMVLAMSPYSTPRVIVGVAVGCVSVPVNKLHTMSERPLPETSGVILALFDPDQAALEDCLFKWCLFYASRTGSRGGLI
jgi:hypothetical protein